MSGVEEIIQGLYKITLPLPMKGLDSVFVYLFRDGDENLLVDTGWNDENSYGRLKDAFSQIDFNIPDLKTIVISHLHPDHIGLATRLRKEAPKSKLAMHQRDSLDLVYTPEAYGILLENTRSFLAMHGTPEEVLKEIVSNARTFEKRFAGISRPDVLLHGGEKIVAGKWKMDVISTPGHTKGNICLYDPSSNILFSGDHVLPTITPNVSLSPLYEGDPLGDFLRSLRNLKRLDPVKILPSHEYVFQHLGKRIAAIEKHHEDRLAEVMKALDAEKSGYEVAEELTWNIGSFEKLSAWQKRAAITETLAHLEYLKRNRKVFEFHEGVDDSESVRYSKIIS
ncbi:MAG: MBL fold metallo-hydrolase [Nitrososphaerales archaeon]